MSRHCILLVHTLLLLSTLTLADEHHHAGTLEPEEKVKEVQGAVYVGRAPEHTSFSSTGSGQAEPGVVVVDEYSGYSSQANPGIPPNHRGVVRVGR